MKYSSPAHIAISACVLIASGVPASGADANGRSDADIAAMLRVIRPAAVERTIRTMVGFGTRNTLSAQNDPRRGIGAARDWLFAEFERISQATGGRLRVEKQSFTQPPSDRIAVPTVLTNVVATLPGDLPPAQERVVVISGHYDSMCTDPTDAVHDAPGANDDASGSAAVLETARALAGHHFRATIVFMCVPGEEQGLYGSGYFARQAKLGGMPVEAMLDNDIIGSSTGGNGVRDAHSVRVFSEGIASDETPAQAALRRSVGGESDSPSRQLARYVSETAKRYVPEMRVRLVARRDRYLRGGDHISFNEQGYAAVRFTEPNEDYRHQHQNVRTENGVRYGDLPEFVDFAYTANVARVNAAVLAMLASAPAPPKEVGLVTRRLSVDTELRWLPVTEPGVAGYEVVWRDTVSPDWAHSKYVGSVTDITLPGLSKDNFFFGVRAVDTAGHKSPVAFPRPVR